MVFAITVSFLWLFNYLHESGRNLHFSLLGYYLQKQKCLRFHFVQRLVVPVHRGSPTSIQVHPVCWIGLWWKEANLVSLTLLSVFRLYRILVWCLNAVIIHLLLLKIDRNANQKHSIKNKSSFHLAFTFGVMWNVFSIFIFIFLKHILYKFLDKMIQTSIVNHCNCMGTFALLK